MIVCDTGPLVSALNRGERRRHEFAVQLLSKLGRRVIVPWPVLVEVDLLLRSRNYAAESVTFCQCMLDGVHRLEAPTNDELALATTLGDKYIHSGADLPDLTVMAMAARRKAKVLTWDYRHFRAVVLRKGHYWPMVVEQDELPEP